MTDGDSGGALLARERHQVLVVNDDPVGRYTITRQLRAAGFRITEAASGLEALDAADESISAVVLDIHLPDIDGFEVCRRLRQRRSTAALPVLHLTASYLRDEDKVRGLGVGANAYLTTPVEPAVLVATLDSMMRSRLAEQQVQVSEAKFRTIYERANCGLCRLDRQGRFIDVNPTMRDYIGCPADDLIGRPVAEFVPAGHRSRIEDFFTRVRPQPDEDRIEFPMIGVDGRLFESEWLLTTGVEPGISMAVVSDVSQRASLERQRQLALDREREARGAAERLSRMKDEFIAVLSHELRTPLNAILGWAFVLQKHETSGDMLRGLASIERNGRMQARLIADLMDMSRLNLGKMRLEFETLDPRTIVDLAINSVGPMRDERGSRIEHQATSTRTIVADASRLEQIVWNLLSNAIKFSPEGSLVRVATRDEGDGVAIIVADSGKGIEPAFLPYLFDRFTQADAASNRFQGGLGLGLSIVQHLVQAHGGTIRASSAGPGLGTEFRVWLPLDSGHEVEEIRDGDASAIGPSPAVARFKGLRILIVDDDRDACEMLQMILSDRGALVSIAHDYEGAFAAVASGAPDVVISDVGMPGKDGYRLAADLRRAEPAGQRRPMIALTSYSRDQDREQALAEGFDAHCAKPLRPLQLLQEIERLTQGRR